MPEDSPEIASLTAYVELVTAKQERAHHSPLWYRGHNRISWPLEPTILRQPYDVDPRRCENILVALFANHGSAYAGTRLGQTFDTLVVMQHHGVPTRLLDWTESALAALYFAVRSFQDETEDAAVHVLDPSAISPKGEIAVVLPDLALQEIENQRLPKAVFPAHITPRVAAQKGRFTVHPLRKGALEEVCAGSLSNGRQVLNHLRVPAKAKERIFWDLKAAGMTESALFPDLDGLGRELRCTSTNGKDCPY